MIRAHNVIIITTSASHLAQTATLDQYIKKVRSLGKNPIVVLGPDGDEFLRHSHHIDDCDLVFDPNYSGCTFSSVKAGLHATNGPAFVVPLNESLPEDELWHHLEEALEWPDQSERIVDVIRIAQSDSGTDAGSDAGSGFGTRPLPQVVTGPGLGVLKSLPATSDWEQLPEARICELEIPAGRHKSAAS